MKKLIFYTLSLFVLLACSKDDDKNKQGGLFSSFIHKFANYELNEEATLVYNHIMASSVSAGIVKNNTFGNFTALKLNGFFGGHTTLTINGTNYSDGGNSDFLLYQANGLDFEQYYGENLTVNIAANEVSFHCPEAIQVNPLNPDSIIINGNIPQIVEWNADPINPIGKIIIHYKIYNQVNGDYSSLIRDDAILIDDNGSFDISTLYSDLGESPKAIDLFYYRGNGRKIPYKNNSDEYFFFTCVSVDFNHYNLVF
jgi:hypothetical protein